MTTWTNYGSKIIDRSRAVRFVNKTIRGEAGAHFYTRAPQWFDHFLAAGVSTTTGPVVSTRTGTGASSVATTGSLAQGGGLTHTAGTATEEFELAVATTVATWKAANSVHKPLVFEARAKWVGGTTATDGTFWIGFADATNYAGVLNTLSTAGVLTSTGPTDAALIGYSSLVTVTGSPGFGKLVGVSTKAATGTLLALTGSSVVTKDSNYHIFGVSVDINGVVSFMVDDKLLGRTGTGAISITGALVPYLYTKSENAHTNKMDIDYWFIGSELV